MSIKNKKSEKMKTTVITPNPEGLPDDTFNRLMDSLYPADTEPVKNIGSNFVTILKIHFVLVYLPWIYHAYSIFSFNRGNYGAQFNTLLTGPVIWMSTAICIATILVTAYALLRWKLRENDAVLAVWLLVSSVAFTILFFAV